MRTAGKISPLSYRSPYFSPAFDCGRRCTCGLSLRPDSVSEGEREKGGKGAIADFKFRISDFEFGPIKRDTGRFSPAPLLPCSYPTSVCRSSTPRAVATAATTACPYDSPPSPGGRFFGSRTSNPRSELPGQTGAEQSVDQTPAAQSHHHLAGAGRDPPCDVRHQTTEGRVEPGRNRGRSSPSTIRRATSASNLEDGKTGHRLTSITRISDHGATFVRPRRSASRRAAASPSHRFTSQTRAGRLPPRRRDRRPTPAASRRSLPTAPPLPAFRGRPDRPSGLTISSSSPARDQRGHRHPPRLADGRLAADQRQRLRGGPAAATRGRHRARATHRPRRCRPVPTRCRRGRYRAPFTATRETAHARPGPPRRGPGGVEPPQPRPRALAARSPASQVLG